MLSNAQVQAALLGARLQRIVGRRFDHDAMIAWTAGFSIAQAQLFSL